MKRRASIGFALLALCALVVGAVVAVRSVDGSVIRQLTSERFQAAGAWSDPPRRTGPPPADISGHGRRKGAWQ